MRGKCKHSALNFLGEHTQEVSLSSLSYSMPCIEEKSDCKTNQVPVPRVPGVRSCPGGISRKDIRPLTSVRIQPCIHLSLCKGPHSVLFHGRVIFHCLYVPHLPYPFTCQWTSRSVPHPGYYKQRCSEHWGTCGFFFFLNSTFLRIYAYSVNTHMSRYR